MKIIKIYEYSNCGTCKKALKFLANHRYAVERIDITTQPPTQSELEKMLTHYGGNFKALFNTAGRVYQDLNLKEKMSKMTAQEAIAMLAKNGKLIKRPFVLFEKSGVVGFSEERWKKVFAK